MLGANDTTKGDFGTSYAEQFVQKPAQFRPEDVRENKQKLEKVSVYMRHPTAQAPGKQHFSSQMRSIFDHESGFAPESQPRMRKQIPRAHESSLKFAYKEGVPGDFYTTSHQKYFSARKARPARGEGGPVENFKAKNSRDHLVLGTQKNLYATEARSNYLDFDVGSMAGTARAPPRRRRPECNPLSFGAQGQFQSTYNSNFKSGAQRGPQARPGTEAQGEGADSLNAFVSNYTRKRREQQSNILMGQGPADFTSSYNSDFTRRALEEKAPGAGGAPPPRAHAPPRQAQPFRNIIAFEENSGANKGCAKARAKLRENTPFATSYNGDFQSFEAQTRKKHFPNLQRTNFVLGEFPQSYLTNNKENFQGKANTGDVLFAGKANRVDEGTMKNLLHRPGPTGVSDYDVFINGGKDKLRYI